MKIFSALLIITAFLIPNFSAAQEERPAEALNILFFGNSLTGINQVYTLVSDVAAAAGQTAPNIFTQILYGKALSDHLQYSNLNATITQSLPPNETWDYVVIQEQSYKPSTVGEPDLFRADAVKLFEEVRAHSPDAYGILFENWARNEGGWPYPPYVKIADMMADIRAATSLARDDIHLNTGGNTAGVAPIGSAWENLHWQGLHDGDRLHATPKGSLLTALVIYRRIYLDDTSDITPTQANAILTKLGLTAHHWTDLTNVTDITDEMPAPLTYLYVVGANRPSGAVELKITGEDNASPVGLWIGSGLLGNPIITEYGFWELMFPITGPVWLTPIPSDNIMVFKATVPATPWGPYTAHLQGIAGNQLTNHYAFEVE